MKLTAFVLASVAAMKQSNLTLTAEENAVSGDALYSKLRGNPQSPPPSRSTAEPMTSMSKSGCSDCDACYYPGGNSCLRVFSQEDCNYYSDKYGTKWCAN
ncbi:hypothetical protein H257_16956 [Aphanomyces astaci]|uniref:Uncharacterized protein n=1 Tax=Aphanomyces astaci TaxID=112090 RepID=W4FGM3_APHAT|nr:hypothetical protein H257_16956 [Aphanomyces astaci]ETV66652.1 hypothetical protein H257_16956 [Aphanomyces astaci]|eukprot:XP_009843880.1 hypothetical protein H257_16956 [Aphanomyces astaci]